MLTHQQNSAFTSQSGTYPLYPTDLPPSGRDEISAIRTSAMQANFGDIPGLATNPQTAISWGILTNLASHDISAMREILGSPTPTRPVSYAARSGPPGEVGWWNVVFDYGEFKAYYEVCPLPFMAGLFSRALVFPQATPETETGVTPS